MSEGGEPEDGGGEWNDVSQREGWVWGLRGPCLVGNWCPQGRASSCGFCLG